MPTFEAHSAELRQVWRKIGEETPEVALALVEEDPSLRIGTASSPLLVGIWVTQSGSAPEKKCQRP